MGDSGRRVMLVNLDNRKMRGVETAYDNLTGEDYIEHDDLLAWSTVTGCTEKVLKTWAADDSPEECDNFIGFIDDGNPAKIEILRNQGKTSKACPSDDIAFYALRLPCTDFGGHVNRIRADGTGGGGTQTGGAT